MAFDRKVKTTIQQENGNKVLYVTMLPTLRKGDKADLEATLTVDGTRHHETAHINLDLSNPGARFLGFGGNFRIQNSKKDPEVIDYCLESMRVAMGRVEFPWAAWDKGGKNDRHVVESAQMAARLKEIGMPVVVSCWFPPTWALEPGSKPQRPGVAALRLDATKLDRSYDAIVSYLLFLKDEYGVEADYFSFNESDIGIDVLHTPQEHCDFIKALGAKMAQSHLCTKMLLGDNGPLRPTQRFHNLRQLAMTPDAFAIPLTVDKAGVNTVAFYNKAQNKGAVHIVNNGASCKADITGLPTSAKKATVYVTNAHQNSEAQQVEAAQGRIVVDMPAESFVTVLF